MHTLQDSKYVFDAHLVKFREPGIQRNILNMKNI